MSARLPAPAAGQDGQDELEKDCDSIVRSTRSTFEVDFGPPSIKDANSACAGKGPSDKQYSTATSSAREKSVEQNTAAVVGHLTQFNVSPGLLTGAMFSQFASLPPELRLMIWKQALLVSRVVALECQEFDTDDEQEWREGVPHLAPMAVAAPLDHTKDTCPESRAMEISLRKTIFCKDANDDISSTKNLKNFLRSNTQMEILWFVQSGRYDDQWHDNPISRITQALTARSIEVRHVALRSRYWSSIGIGAICKHMEEFQKTGTEKIILVVGDMSAAEFPDVVFVEPLHSPDVMHDWDYISAIASIDSLTNPAGIRTADWKGLEAAWTEHLEYVKSELAEEHEANDGNGISNPSSPRYDCEKWTVKRFLYREAVTRAELDRRRLLPGWDESQVIPKQ